MLLLRTTRNKLFCLESKIRHSTIDIINTYA